MKKIITFICIVFFTAISCFAQTEFSKNNFNLSVGAGIPLGKFSSKDPNNEFAGYAKTGVNIALSWEHKIKKNFFFNAMLFGAENGLNTNAMANSFSKTGMLSFYGNPRYYGNWSVDKKRWYTGALLVGASVESSIGEESKLFYLIKIVAGVAHLQYPKISANSKTDTSYAVYNQTGGGAFSFAYLLEVGLKYKFNNKWAAIFKVNHFQTGKFNFKDVTTTVAATNGGLVVPKVYELSNSKMTPLATATTSSTKQVVDLLNINLGVSYSF
ncbi:MAG: hypothetical protein QM726_00785 [Chitinophagaceae bacterium]